MARMPKRMISSRNRRQNTDKLSTKIQKYANLSVTLTKRRLTTYRRASELSTLTGADVAIITFSSSSNNNNNNNRFARCFGSPDVHSVVDRYLNNGGDHKPAVDQELIQRMVLTKDLNEKSNLLEREYEYQQERARVLDRMVEERKGNNNNKNNNYWWDAPVEKLDLGATGGIEDEAAESC